MNDQSMEAQEAEVAAFRRAQLKYLEALHAKPTAWDRANEYAAVFWSRCGGGLMLIFFVALTAFGCVLMANCHADAQKERQSAEVRP